MDNKDIYLNVGTTSKVAVKGGISMIPYIGNILNEIWDEIDSQLLDKRMQVLEEKLRVQDSELKLLQDRIMHFSEHDYYFVRNSIKSLIIECIPESSTEVADCIAKFIYEIEKELQEEIIEIVLQLNVHDISLIKMIKNYLNKGTREYYEKMKITDVSDSKYSDRNMIYGENTIFMEDFNNFIRIPKSTLCDYLNGNYTKNGEETFEISYIGISILKFQKLGMVQNDFITTMGNSSVNNIDRIHITNIGKKVIDCFKEI